MTAKYFSEEELGEIEHLMKSAFMCPNKKEASRYIQQIRRMGYGGLLPPANHIFSELLSAIERASGRVKDKPRLMYFAEMSLLKLHGLSSKATVEDEIDGE